MLDRSSRPFRTVSTITMMAIATINDIHVNARLAATCVDVVSVPSQFRHRCNVFDRRLKPVKRQPDCYAERAAKLVVRLLKLAVTRG